MSIKLDEYKYPDPQRFSGSVSSPEIPVTPSASPVSDIQPPNSSPTPSESSGYPFSIHPHPSHYGQIKIVPVVDAPVQRPTLIDREKLRESLRHCFPIPLPEGIDSDDESPENEISENDYSPRFHSERFKDDQLDRILMAAHQIDWREHKIEGEEHKLARSLLVGTNQKGEPTVYLLLDRDGDFLIGEGSLGKVEYAIDLRNGEIAAVKTCRKAVRNDIHDRLGMIEHEKQVMTELRGRTGILQLYCTVDTPSTTYFILENCAGGDLNHALQETNFSNKPSLRIATEIATSMLEMKQCNYTHRDLKSENVLLVWDAKNKEWHTRVGDFGFATKAFTDPAIREGSVECWSPVKCMAVLQKNKLQIIDYRAEDIWSFGLILYNLFHEEHKDLIRPVKKKKEESDESYENRWMERISQFIVPRDLPEIKNKAIARLLLQIFNPASRAKLTWEAILSKLTEVYESKYGPIPES